MTEYAFPISSTEEGRLEVVYGLTKREYFVGVALQGLCANPNTNYSLSDALATLAVEHADAVLKILNIES